MSTMRSGFDPHDAIVDAIAASTRARSRTMSAVGGGSINLAFRVELEDGQTLFAKSHPDPPNGFFAAEAHGLEVLGSARAIRVPAVIAHAERALVLEWIEPSGTASQERLGRALAELHQCTSDAFGLDRDNFMGSVPQPNRLQESWPEFYATRRLEPLVKQNVETGRLPSGTTARAERLFARIGDLCGPPEPPALLHGDLWGGNCMWSRGGEPVLIDPAVYWGHREIDLAMMRLFGGFTTSAFAAYDEVYPLSPGHEDRVGLCQLYPLLVHVTLFGGGYAGSFLDTLNRYT